MLGRIFRSLKNLRHSGGWKPLAKPPRSVTVSNPGNGILNNNARKLPEREIGPKLGKMCERPLIYPWVSPSILFYHTGQFFLSVCRKEKLEGIRPHWGNFFVTRKIRRQTKDQGSETTIKNVFKKSKLWPNGSTIEKVLSDQIIKSTSLDRLIKWTMIKSVLTTSTNRQMDRRSRIKRGSSFSPRVFTNQDDTTLGKIFPICSQIVKIHGITLHWGNFSVAEKNTVDWWLRKWYIGPLGHVRPTDILGLLDM